MIENEMTVSVPLEVVKASEIEPKEVKWLWYPYIPFGKVTLLQGDPGDGKSKLRIPAGGVLSAGRPFDRGEHLGICAEIEIRGISMKLNCKRIDFTYTPGEEIFNFPEESGLPFIFDVEEELTGDPAVMDAVGEMLDEAEKLAEKAKAAIKAALADEDSRYHSVVTFFMEFHRDDVGPDIVAELFPGTDPAKLSFAEMVDFLKLKRFGSLVDSEMNQQVFILDLSFNPEITDELMVIYFDLNKEIFCITHES